MADTTQMISPGVYTNIISLDSYLTSTSGTIGFVPVITEKGEDNVLKRITSYQEYVDNFGEPDIRTFGKYYGCGPYIATQHLSVSSDLYVLRALPEDAGYAHTFIYFSDVNDFPKKYQFAREYQDVICDGAMRDINIYAVNEFDGNEALQRNAYRAAIQDEVAYDEDKVPVTDVDEWKRVKYVSKKDPKYTAFTATYEVLYRSIKSDSVVDAIIAGEAYAENTATTDNLYDVVPVTFTEDEAGATEGDAAWDLRLEKIASAVWTTPNSQYADANGTVKYGPTETSRTYVDSSGTVGVKWEPTSSAADGNVGFTKINTEEWYDGTHTSLSAFSVADGIDYAVQSDLTCKKPTMVRVSVYPVDPQKVLEAFKAKALVAPISEEDPFLYVVLDEAEANSYAEALLANAESESESTADTVVTPKVYTTKLAFTEAFDDNNAATTTTVDAVVGLDAKVISYEFDVRPWYVVDPAKAQDAINNYAAFDENGYLTTDVDNVSYTSKSTYAKKNDSTREMVTEEDVPLYVPKTSRFKVGAADNGFDGFLFTMNRKAVDFESKALEDIKTGCAFDLNGEPARSVSDVYVTSNEGHAVMAVSPRMTNTQKLDSLFYGNDTLITAMIKEIKNAPAIYSKNNRLAHNSILGYVRAVGRGSYYNDYSIKITSDANPSSFGTYKFQVFKLEDGVEVLAESYNVSFDPTALDADGETLYWADVINKFSSMVRVEANEGSLDLYNAEFAEFYHNDPTIAEIADGLAFTENGVAYNLVGGFPSKVPTFDSKEDSDTFGQILDADINEFVDPEYDAETPYFGYKARMVWEAYYAKAWAEKATFDASAEYNKALALSDDDPTKTYQIETAIEAMDLAQQMTDDATEIFGWATSRNLMNMNDSDPVTAGEQTYYLENGTLGSLIDSRKGTVVPQIGDQILSKAYTGLLKNPVVVKSVDESTGNIKYKQQYTDNVYDTDWIYFSTVYDPGYKPNVKQAALELVDTYRRDCVLISDCGDNADYEDCLKYVGAVKGAKDARIWNTYLAARYEPYSRVYDKFTAKDIWVSPVYHMAKLLPQTDALYNLWYAAAGFTRGACSDIKELRYSPNKAQRDLFYQAQVNPIVYFPEGMTVWGQLTTQKKNDSLSDLNVVKTVLYIKRALEQFCRNYVFEFNEQTTWDSIHGAIAPFLDTIVANKGLRGYSIEVGATDYELKTKVCHVNVTLDPMKVLEKIQLNFYVK